MVGSCFQTLTFPPGSANINIPGGSQTYDFAAKSTNTDAFIHSISFLTGIHLTERETTKITKSSTWIDYAHGHQTVYQHQRGELLLGFSSFILAVKDARQPPISKIMVEFQQKSKARIAVVGGGVSGIACLWGLRGTET